MRDPNRIYKICHALAEQWSRVPDWRLTQLFNNLQRYDDSDLYYLEEDEFLERLKIMLDKIVPK
jgi:hypothetical protein